MPATLVLPVLYEAIVGRLKSTAAVTGLLASGAAGVYNVAPAGALFPYVEVGSGTEVSFNTLGANGAECTVQVSARSQSSGAGSDLPVLTIIRKVIEALVSQSLTVAGFASVVVSLDVVPPIFTEVVDNRAIRTQPLILRVHAHEAAR